MKSIVIPKDIEYMWDWALGYGNEFDVSTESYVKLPDFTIYGYSDTVAEAYAKENGFTFIEIKDEPVEEPAENPTKKPTEAPSDASVTVEAVGELSPKLESSKDEIISAIAKLLTAEQLSSVKDGKTSLDIKLSVTGIDGISDSEKELIAKAVEGIADNSEFNFKVMNYLDIKLSALIDDRELSVSETEGLLTVSVELEKPANGTYKVVRIHDGRADVIDAATDKSGARLTFKTDKFSTYAIVYSDVASGESTSNIPKAIFVSAALMFAALFTANKFRAAQRQ